MERFSGLQIGLIGMAGVFIVLFCIMNLAVVLRLIFGRSFAEKSISKEPAVMFIGEKARHNQNIRSDTATMKMPADWQKKLPVILTVAIKAYNRAVMQDNKQDSS